MNSPIYALNAMTALSGVFPPTALQQPVGMGRVQIPGRIMTPIFQTWHKMAVQIVMLCILPEVKQG